jgi:hypothetical protein
MVIPRQTVGQSHHRESYMALVMLRVNAIGDHPCMKLLA